MNEPEISNSVIMPAQARGASPSPSGPCQHPEKETGVDVIYNPPLGNMSTPKEVAAQSSDTELPAQIREAVSACLCAPLKVVGGSVFSLK